VKHGQHTRFTRAMAVRMVADALMVSAALLAALLLRYLWDVGMAGSAVPAHDLLLAYLQDYVNSFWLLVPISLIVFYSSGFYTRGRFYRDRYKALVIVQAISVGILIFGLFVLLLRETISFPRSALFLTWLLEMALVGGARLWTVLWAGLKRAEIASARTRGTDEGTETVLVIGGAGYIGSALVERLLELGYRTRVLDILLYGDASISRFRAHPNFEFVRGDFRFVDTVVKAARGVDAIVHLGAIVGDSACAVDEDLTVEVNLRATRTIAEVGKGFGCRRFIFASTCSVYGASNEILDERSSLSPLSLYARTKIESEKVLLRLGDREFAPTILRFGTIYGLSGRPRFDLVVNLLTAKAIQDGQAGIFGGAQWRPLVHVRDVAEAIVQCLRAAPAVVHGQTFNVGCNEQNYQIAELGRMIKETIPEAHVVTQPQEDNRNYRVSFDKIRDHLGFRPQHTVRDGIQEIVDAFDTGRITDYRDPRYSNFAFLQANGDLECILGEDRDAWAWAKLSATDAAMLAQLAKAAFECQRRELRDRLYEAMQHAMLGDVDGYLCTLADTDLVPHSRAAVSLVPS
jgi:nucleoside-diphosphate-sugar epimerase